MAYYKLIADSHEKLRQVLREISTEKFIYSSCYQLGDKLHLLVSIPDGVVVNSNQVEFYEPKLELTHPIDTLWNWAYSELTRDLNWLRYEDEAISISEGCFLNSGPDKIIRLFLPLTETMLIINQTPDSFSDGGEYYLQIDKIINKIEIALQDGVTLIDIGAESTKPNASYVEVSEEIKRLAPIIEAVKELKSSYSFKLSLDSYKSETIHHFFSDIDIINDVSGNLPKETLCKICDHGKIYLFMHSLTIPANPKVILPIDLDPCEEVLSWAKFKLETLFGLGFTREQLICDIGIGFNKTMAQSWHLINHIDKFRELEIPILVGHSRKRFLGRVTSQEFAARDLESAMVSSYLAAKGIDYLRLHDYSDYYRLINVAAQFRRAGIDPIR